MDSTVLLEVSRGLSMVKEVALLLQILPQTRVRGYCAEAFKAGQLKPHYAAKYRGVLVCRSKKISTETLIAQHSVSF